MKKLHSLAFYALITPAITLGSSALLAAQDTSEERDVGEQSMGADADSETQNSEKDKKATKSKYNEEGSAGETEETEETEETDQKKGDQSGKQNED
ncbi:MAG: hypothetical protein WD623_17325 [Marinobacter sp.]|uniref:hypothetical protein n=1 Tax=Marinobacter sp. TaxID=50741 RepID=UPI00349FDF3B